MGQLTLGAYDLSITPQPNYTVQSVCTQGIGAALFHGVLMFQPSSLSTDVFRYLWDGHVAAHGAAEWWPTLGVLLLAMVFHWKN